MKFTLAGIPQSKDRPRFFKTKMGIRCFDPQKAQSLKLKKHLQNIMTSHENEEDLSERIDLPFADIYQVEATFYLPIPKSDSKSKVKAKLDGILKHDVKPDIDNLQKFILDAMSGIMYSDDKKVIRIVCEKKYSDEPRTEIEIKGFYYEKRRPAPR